SNLPKDLQRILQGKVVSANLHIYCQLPKEEYLEERKRIKDTVRKYRWKVLCDSSVRKKTRIAALVTYFGFDTTSALFHVLKKRRPTL
ncbi:MAG: hypothetical protein KBS81_00445, partial [Spirochaetales bacterium]|nr:hypothetical protein [Candidatus Physcosoma equi]